MKVLLLFDLAAPPPADQDYSEDLRPRGRAIADEWESEASVAAALERLGHVVKPFGICDDIQILIDEIRLRPPDVVFNLTEAFERNRAHEPHVASLLELLGIKYTGARPAVLQICKDKVMTKKILSHSGVRTPSFELSRKAQRLQTFKHFVFPAFVKPVGLESSAGIARDSLVENEKQCLERVRFVHERLGQDALVEEYIEGRELYVGVLGNEDSRIEAFPPRELFFEAVPEGDPKFATFKAKWDDNYRKKWGIRNGPAWRLAPELEASILDTCKKIYRALRITGYARIDLRLTPRNEIVFLEANPNPSIAEKDDFAQAALAGGLSYEKLIAKIIKLSGAGTPARRRSGLSSRCAEVF